MKNTIRQIYFYAATLIFLMMTVVSTVSLLNLGLKTYVFPKADQAYKATCDYDEYGNVYSSYEPRPVMVPEPAKTGEPERRKLTEEERAVLKGRCESAQKEQRSAERQRDLVQNLSMLIVAAPLFWLHFKWVQKERETEIALAKEERKA